MKTKKSIQPFFLRFFLLIAFLSSLSITTDPKRTVNAKTEGELILYVDGQNGNDSGNLCDDSSNPCKSIQRAINVLFGGQFNPPYGDMNVAYIKISTGIYRFDSTQWSGGDLSPFTPCPFQEPDQSVVCIIDENVTLEGGYSSSNWTAPSSEPKATVIDGEGSRRGILAIGSNIRPHVAVKNLTVKNGMADEGSFSGNEDNSFGGGMFAFLTSVDVADVVFDNNTALGIDTGSDAGGNGAGGGLAISAPQSGTTPGESTLTNVEFLNNSALAGSGPVRGGVSLGGGLFTFNTTITGEGIRLENNTSQAGNSPGNGFFGGLFADALGGGIAFSNNTTATFTNVTATGNQAIGGNSGDTGGGSFGGAIHVEESDLTLTDSYLAENVSLGGNGATGGFAFSGAIEIFNSNATINRTQIISNRATGGSSTTGGTAGAPSGGGSYTTSKTSDHEVTITNSIFADNLIEFGTGTTELGGGGGGVVVQGLKANLTHNTFTGNRLGVGLRHGAAVLIQASLGTTGLPGIAHMSFNIFADNTSFSNQDAVHITENSTGNFNTDLFKEDYFLTNADKDWTGLPPGTINGFGTIIELGGDQSMEFVSPGDPEHDYHLQATSPAINQAIGSTTPDDIDGDSRPQGSASDIGADEYTAPTLTASPSSISFLSDGSNIITNTIAIGVTSGPQINWTASTQSNWVYLGETGTANNASGLTGEDLVVRLDASGLNEGTHNASITATSNDADSVTITVEVTKVDELFFTFLPLILR